MRRLLPLLGVLVLVLFALFVVRETAGVVQLARDVDPRLGQAVLWGLLALYAVCLGVPAVMFMALPRPLVAPPSEDDPRFPAHVARLARRLARNRHLAGMAVTPDRTGVTAALARLDTIADEHIRRVARLVFASTALSQNGRLDALFVLTAQSRLVWRIAHVYQQRPSARQMLRLYTEVALTVFAASALEDLDLGEMIEPLMPPMLEATLGGSTVVLAPAATLVADMMLQGTVNALLTSRVGCIAKRYSGGMPQPDRRTVRRLAARDARALLGGNIGEWITTLRGKVWERVQAYITGTVTRPFTRLRQRISGGAGATAPDPPAGA